MGRKKRDCIWVMVKSLARFLVIHWISYCISIIYNTWTVLTQFKFQEMLKFCLYIKGLGMGWVGEWTGGMTPQKLDLFREGIGRPPPPTSRRIRSLHTFTYRKYIILQRVVDGLKFFFLIELFANTLIFIDLFTRNYRHYTV